MYFIARYVNSKAHLCFFSSYLYRPSKPFALIHSDIWGPSRVLSITNKHWFITLLMIILVCVGCTLWKKNLKSLWPSKFFFSMIKTQFNDNIQILRTDNGSEYFNSVLKKKLTKKALFIRVRV